MELLAVNSLFSEPRRLPHSSRRLYHFSDAQRGPSISNQHHHEIVETVNYRYPFYASTVVGSTITAISHQHKHANHARRPSSIFVISTTRTTVGAGDRCRTSAIVERALVSITSLTHRREHRSDIRTIVEIIERPLHSLHPPPLLSARATLS